MRTIVTGVPAGLDPGRPQRMRFLRMHQDAEGMVAVYEWLPPEPQTTTLRVTVTTQGEDRLLHQEDVERVTRALSHSGSDATWEMEGGGDDG
jgi:predicted esterase